MAMMIFWFLAILIFYIYFGYPLLLWFICKIRPEENWKIQGHRPDLSVIISAFNEREVIQEKIKNILNSDYPRKKMQVIVASDASDDGTDEIVKRFAEKNVILYKQKKRLGKSRMLNNVVRKVVAGEVIIFTDATTLFEKNAIPNIINKFCNKDVGAVAGRLIFKSFTDGAVAGNHGLYWGYETFLRRKEGTLGALPFVSGAFYAIKKGLYAKVRDGFPDDSVSPLNVLKNGKKVVFADDAVAYEQGPQKAKDEFRIKIRGVIRELASILDSKALLNPFKNPLVSFVLLSHRLLRWCVPFLLLGIYTSTAGLISYGFFKLILWCQNLFYLLALSGVVLERARIFPKFISIPFYFCLVNISAAVGIVRFIFGARQAIWTPVRSR